MLRYYMTAETREALIAESNRLIAARARAKSSGATREVPSSDFGALSQCSLWGALPYQSRGPANAPTYQGLVSIAPSRPQT